MIVFTQVKILLAIIIVNLCILTWGIILFVYNRFHRNYSPKEHYFIFRFFLVFITLFSGIIVFSIINKEAATTLSKIGLFNLQHINSISVASLKFANAFGPDQINYIFVTWTSITLMFFIFDTITYFANKNKLINNTKFDSNLESITRKVMKELKIRNEIPVYYSDVIATPAIIGMFKAIILIPTIFENHKEIEMIITHELYHYKEKDTWIRWYLDLLKCLFWFNPAIYYALKGYDFLRESSCDESVLNQSNEIDKIKYIQAIIEAAEYAQRSEKQVLSVTLVNQQKSQLLMRIDMMLNSKEKNSSSFMLMTICLVGMLFVILSVHVLFEAVYFIAAIMNL